MEIAVWDSLKPRPGRSHVQLYREHLAEVAVAEECGFQRYWFLEHHLTPVCPLPSPNLFIAAAAQHTARIRLGNMVNVLPFRNPLVLAEEIAMLDTLTDGRLDVGIGRGLKPTEFETFGVAQDDSRAIFLEALDVLLGVWQHDTFSYHGRYCRVDKRTPLSPPLVQQPHPPLFVSAQSRDSLRWAAERNLPFGQIDARLDDCQRDQAYYRAVQVASGHAPIPRLFVTREVYVDESDQRARADALPHLKSYWDVWNRYTQFTLVGKMPDSYDAWRQRAPALYAMSYDELIAANMVLVGDPAHVAAQIVAHQHTLDPAILVCVFQLGHLSHQQVVRSMRLFAGEVLPRVQAALAVTAHSGFRGP